MAVLQRERDRLLQDESLTEIQRKELEDEWQSKLERMREVFERARPKEEKKRVVPDWAIDDISFCVMVDPVIVSIIIAHLLRSGVLDKQAFAWQTIREELWRISDMTPCDRLKQASPTSAHPSSSTCAALRPIPSLGSLYISLTCGLIWILSKPARSSSLRMDGPLTGRLGSQKSWCLPLGCGQQIVLKHHTYLVIYFCIHKRGVRDLIHVGFLFLVFSFFFWGGFYFRLLLPVMRTIWPYNVMGRSGMIGGKTNDNLLN